jgi:PAS domain S-box-containing protein
LSALRAWTLHAQVLAFVITLSSDTSAVHLETLRQITVQMTVARDVAEVLEAITGALVTTAGVALARIWLHRSATDCPTCCTHGWQQDSAKPPFALHLTASAGLYSHVDGALHRIEVGDRKVGEIAASKRAIWTDDVASDLRIVNKEWVRQNALQSFAGYPLLFRNDLVGVLGVFSRQRLGVHQFQSLEVFAAQAATAIKTAELFSKAERSEAYLIAAQELSHTGAWSRRISTGEGYWSEETYRIFGLDPISPPPSPQPLLQVWHPDDRDLLDRAMDAATREKRGFEVDLRVVRPDKSVRYVHAKGQPVVNDAGDVVEFIGVIMDVTKRKRAERALRRARDRTLAARFSAVLAERTRMAREIHDTLLQGFTGVSLKLVAVTARVTGQPETSAALREVIALAQSTLQDARRAVWDMRPPSLGSQELPDALKTAAEDGVHGTGLTLEYEAEGPSRPLDPKVEAVIFRIGQEAIANAVKHAAARTLRVRCTYGARRVRLSVADDGRGFTVDPDFRAYGGHWGLLGMRERASQIGARVLVRSTPGQGTEVILLAPYAVRERLPYASRSGANA